MEIEGIKGELTFHPDTGELIHKHDMVKEQIKDKEQLLKEFYNAPWSAFNQKEYDNVKKEFTEYDMIQSFQRGVQTPSGGNNIHTMRTIFNKWLRGWKITGENIA